MNTGCIPVGFAGGTGGGFDLVTYQYKQRRDNSIGWYLCQQGGMLSVKIIHEKKKKGLLQVQTPVVAMVLMEEVVQMVAVEVFPENKSQK